MKRFTWAARVSVFLSLVFCLAGTSRAEPLLRIQDGSLFVDAPGGVDITVTCGQWGAIDTGSGSVLLHQEAYMDYFSWDIRAFNNVDLGKQYKFYYFQQDREILLYVLDHTTQTRYFPGPAWRNPDNRVHAVIQQVPGNENSFHVGFEHSPFGGDSNFTDTQFTVTATPSLNSSHPDPQKIDLGINLTANNYYSTQLLFVDAMKSAMPWVTNNDHTVPGGQNPWDSGVINQIPCDENGYPLSIPYNVPGTEAPQVVTTLLYRVNGLYPGGVYTVLYEGEGELRFAFDAQVLSSEPGRMRLQVTPSANGILMKIMSSKAGNHIRNIRVIAPGFESTYEQQVFNPLLLERYKDMSAIRFMDLGNTNTTTVASWAQRPRTTYYTQGTENGIALEYMILLANKLDKDAWFCVPHMADDAYVRSMARLIRDTLNPGRKAYIEYSNEVWNSIFPQSRYAQEMGCEAGLAGDCNDGIGDVTDKYLAGVRFIGKRSAEIFRIFDEEFSSQTSRIVKVLPGQMVSKYVQQNILDTFNNPLHNPYGVNADAIAVTGYFGCQANLIGQHNEIDTITVDEILDRTEESITLIMQYFMDNKKIADDNGLELIAYEGGQHLVATAPYVYNDTLTAKLIAANRHPRMKEITEKMFDAWFNYGGGRFMYFSSVGYPAKFGSWGALEYIIQPVTEAPKYLALSQYAQRNKVPVRVLSSSGAPYRGLNVYAYTGAGEYSGVHTITGEDGYAYFMPGDFEAGQYKFRADFQGYMFWSSVVTPAVGQAVTIVIDKETTRITVTTASGPVQNATVCVHPVGRPETSICGTTDADGHVSFDLPVGGSYTFMATLLGHQYSTDAVITGGGINTIALPMGGGVFRIHAVKSSGVPLAGMTIELRDRYSVSLGVSCTTSSTGTAEFTVPAGVYRFACSYLGYKFPSNEISVTQDTSVEFPIAHQDIEITVNQQFQGVDTPVQGVSVRLFTPVGVDTGYAVQTDATGYAVFNLPAVAFKARVQYVGQEFISEEFTWQDVSITMPIAEARVKAVWDDGQPLAGMTVSVFSSTGASLGISGTTNAQGTAVFRLPAGSYIFSVNTYVSVYESDVTTLVADGANNVTIQTGTSVSLTVTKASDKPLRGVNCALFSGSGEDLALSFRTDKNGRVYFNLPDGSFQFRVDYLGTETWSQAITVPSTRSVAVQVPYVPHATDIGMNIARETYYARQLMFVDAMKTAMPWVTQNSYSVPGGQNPFNTNVLSQIPLDANGYPLQLPVTVPGTEAPQVVATLLLYTIDGHYPGGVYTVLYDGIGTFQFRNDAAVIHQEPGRIQLQVTPGNLGISMKILSSDPSDHVRNIRVIMPGYENTYQQQIFYQPFLDRLKGMKALRMKDLMRISDNTGTTWSQRTTTGYYTQDRTQGVAIEHLIDLANRTGIDPWFTIPNQANDEYVTNLARLIYSRLGPARKVYVDYGVYDSAMRSVRIFEIFENEFGDDERLVKILWNAFSYNEGNTRTLLERFFNPAYNPMGITLDALAVPAYFGSKLFDEIIAKGEAETITVDEIIGRAEASIFGSLLGEILMNKRYAEQYNIKLFACEGGQYLRSLNNVPLTSKFLIANRDPRMKDLYDYLFDIWFNNGGSLFVPYVYVANPSGGASWGLLEYQDQPVSEAPKYQSVTAYGDKDFTVQVRTSSGNRLAGYQVYAFTQSGSYTGHCALTDNDGIAVFPYGTLADGSYRFRVTYLGYQFWTGMVTIPESSTADLLIQGNTVSVTVATRFGAVQGARVYLFSEGGVYLGIYGITDENGVVSFELPVGMNYKFRADFMSFQYWSDTATVSGEAVNTVPVDVGGGVFSITVGKALGQPISGTPVYLFSSAGSYLNMTQRADESGKVIFEVPKGSYKVRADYLGGQYWSAAAQINDEDEAIDLFIPHRDVTVSAVSVYQDLRTPLAGVNLYLFTPAGSYLSITQATDANARAVFSLPEKPFKVRADYLCGQYWSEEFTWQDSLVEVPLAMAQVAVSRAGLPLGKVNVYAFNAEGSYLNRFNETSDAGTVSFILPAGSYKFRADYQGSQYWSEVAILVADQASQAVINTGGGELAVTVDKGSGGPLEGIDVHLYAATGNFLGFSQKTDAQGTARFAVSSGAYKIRADYLGIQYWSDPVQVSSNASVSLPIPHQDVVMSVQTVYQGAAAPLEGVQVYLFTPGGAYMNKSVTTDEEGEAVFTLPEQAFKTRIDYLTGQYWSEEFTWQDSETNIPMGQAGVTVTRQGSPVEGVSVYAFTAAGSYLNLSGTTDAAGAVSFTLPAGDYKFRADYNASLFWSEVAVLDPDGAKEVSISTGGGVFSVTISKGPDAPMQATRVYLFTSTGTYLNQSLLTDASGKASFNVADGSYKIRADYMGSRFWSESVQVNQDVSVALAIPHRDITVAVMSTCEVVDTPLAGMRVYLFNAAGAYLNLYTMTGSAGTASFNVPDGSYKIRADYMSSQYWSETLQVSEDTSVSISIPHQDTAITVQSTYQGVFAPMSGVNVYLFTSTGSYLNQYRTTDSQGRAVYRLPEKEYKVRADFLGLQHWSPVFTRQDSTVEIAYAQARVRVTSGDTALAGIRVYVFSLTGLYLSISGLTDADGYTVFPLPAGSYRFRADYQGTQFWSGDTALARDAVTPVGVSAGGGQ